MDRGSRQELGWGEGPKRRSDTGNRTPSYRVKGGNVSRYTISDDEEKPKVSLLEQKKKEQKEISKIIETQIAHLAS